jgi:uncharacterized protein (TIGR03435 family)
MQGVDELAKALVGPAGETIVDRTGLSGKYDFTLKFSSPAITATMAQRAASDAVPGASAPDPSESWPPLKQALLEQLGLQLQSAKAVLDFLVVDHFNKTPTDN